jgi:peptide/nickel transport system permease protein
MTTLRRAAFLLLMLIALTGLLAPVLAPHPYDLPFRDSVNAPAGPRFLMGTDELGRDRFSRLLYGTSISALLAPAAALCSVALALLITSLSAAGRAFLTQGVNGFTTICLSLPWLFLFIVLRGALPLNTSPALSIALTFGLMGVAGWAWPARVFTASILEIRESGWLMQARAAGISARRIALAYAWPHMRSLASAQFRILIPSYVLSEASLGLLGLGVPNPIPSWGNLLGDLQHPDIVRANPWVLAPLGLLVVVMICLETLAPAKEVAL